MEAKTGDFFRHSRLGTVRVEEIGSDFVLVHQRNGNSMRLSHSEADRQMRPIPSEGFYALTYQRDPDADWLRENVEDVVERMMRDRRLRSIDLEDIKRELLPILSKQQRKWDSWWKAARKNLLSGSRFTTDPKRKTRFLVRSAAPQEPGDQLVARIRALSDPQDLLHMARELDVYPAPERSQAAKDLADNILTRLGGLDIQSHEFSELFCGLCYAASSMVVSKAADLMSRVTQTTFDRMSTPPGLDRDFVSALSALSRISFPKWTDFAKALLAHASTEVASKAFSALNTEANRQSLKTTLLSWVSDPKLATTPRIELYLRQDFVRHLRQEDLRRLYLRLIDQPPLWETPAVREFLNTAEIAGAVVKDPTTDLREKAAILCSQAVKPDMRLTLAKSVADPDALLTVILTQLDSELEHTATACLPGLIPSEEFSSWKALLQVIRMGHHPDLVGRIAESFKRAGDESSAPDLLTLAKRAAQLYELAQDEYPESAEVLARSLETLGRRLFESTSARWTSHLLQVFRSELEKGKRDLVSENSKLRQQGAELAAKLKENQIQTERLRDLAEMLKLSASFDKQEIEAQIRIEAYRPILLLLDDLERQASADGESPITHLISMLASTLERAGVRRVGVPGEVCRFDPDLHEFVQGPEKSSDNANVRVLRSGFVLDTARGPRLIRRAAVRTQ